MKVESLRLPSKKHLFNVVSLTSTTYVMVLWIGGCSPPWQIVKITSPQLLASS